MLTNRHVTSAVRCTHSPVDLQVRSAGELAHIGANKPGPSFPTKLQQDLSFFLWLSVLGFQQSQISGNSRRLFENSEDRIHDWI